MRRSPQAEARQLRAFAMEAARLMVDRHCEDVRLLDLRGLSQVCDYLLVGSGTSDRQMMSVAQELQELGAGQDAPLYRCSADRGATWIILDFVDLVVHLFEPGRRAHYDLEGLWSDAEEVGWMRQEQPSRKAGPGDEGAGGA
jgi:ribosome-associated protein